VYEFLASAGAKYGVGFWRPGSGIIHQVIVVVAVSIWRSLILALFYQECVSVIKMLHMGLNGR